MDGAEQIPLNKVVQKDNGQYVKCAPNGVGGAGGGEIRGTEAVLADGAGGDGSGGGSGGGGSGAVNGAINLLLRNLTEGEFIELTTKKVGATKTKPIGLFINYFEFQLARQNLVEYFGVGRRAFPS